MRRGGARAAAAVLLVLAAACAHTPPTSTPENSPADRAEPRADGAETEIGLASYYGRAFHGRRTASGARYDMHALTCAHPSAPFGTRLRITEIESGRSVDVTVTDRGPFAPGRVVDLSLAAARRLGMTARGLVRVRVVRVE
jgi:peptidoglycan lytic transglycosylase